MSRTCRAYEPLKDAAQVDAALEQLLDLGEAAARIAAEAEGVMIAEQRVHSSVRKMLDAFAVAACDVAVMMDAGALRVSVRASHLE